MFCNDGLPLMYDFQIQVWDYGSLERACAAERKNRPRSLLSFSKEPS